MRDRFDKLTERERQCLHLVRAQMSSKEIGLRLGLDAGTVDQHIKSAMRVLDVHKRGLAALALEAHEREAVETLDSESPDVAGPPEIATLAEAMQRGGSQKATGPDHMLREAHAPFKFVPFRPTSWPLRPAGGGRSDLTTLQIIGWSVAAIFGAILCLAMLLDGVGVLERVGGSIYRGLR